MGLTQHHPQYMILDDNQWSDETLHGIIDRIGELPVADFLWAKLTSFNISSPAPNNSSAFPWQDSGYALLRGEINMNNNATNASTNAQVEAWYDEFDTFLRGAMGYVTDFQYEMMFEVSRLTLG